MIKTFYEVDVDADFFKELAELLSIKDESHTIYLSSNGGDIWLVEPILKMINDNKERLETLILKETSLKENMKKFGSSQEEIDKFIEKWYEHTIKENSPLMKM